MWLSWDPIKTSTRLFITSISLTIPISTPPTPSIEKQSTYQGTDKEIFGTLTVSGHKTGSKQVHALLKNLLTRTKQSTGNRSLIWQTPTSMKGTCSPTTTRTTCCTILRILTRTETHASMPPFTISVLKEEPYGDLQRRRSPWKITLLPRETEHA